MGAVSAVLRRSTTGITFWCAGCNRTHHINTGPQGWQWNGDVEKPVLSPSISIKSGHYASHWKAHDPETGKPDPCWCTYNAEHPEAECPFSCQVCHSFVGINGAQPGQIIYLSDCTHALANRTIDLPRKWEHEWTQNQQRQGTVELATSVVLRAES